MERVLDQTGGDLSPDVEPVGKRCGSLNKPPLEERIWWRPAGRHTVSLAESNYWETARGGFPMIEFGMAAEKQPELDGDAERMPVNDSA